ncbi:hypothetical protein ACUHMQ_18085 [Chitinimonas sp. PSY-7]
MRVATRYLYAISNWEKYVVQVGYAAIAWLEQYSKKDSLKVVSQMANS